MVSDYIAGNAYDKEIAQPLIKDIHRGDPGVGTGEDRCYRLLARNKTLAAFFAMVWMFEFTGNKSFVAVFENLKNLFSSGLS
jgi:hypothetical protein